MTTLVDSRQVTLVPPGTWEVDSARSTVGFDVRHLKITHVRGCFRAVAAAISCDSQGVASIAGLVSVASIDAGDPRRDARLCTKDFFDVEHHPAISFSGVTAPVAAGDPLVVRGTMTMRGASRPLELRAESSPAADGNGNDALRIRAHGEVSRREFGLAWDSAFAAGGLVINDRVGLELDLAVVRLLPASADGTAGIPCYR